MFGVYFFWLLLVGSKPGEHKGNALAFFHRELRHGRQIFPVRFNRRAQHQSIRTSNRLQRTISFSHPWNDVPVIKANDQLHFHGDAAAHAFDNPNDVGIFAAWRHEIDQAHRAAGRLDFGF